jgi:hypothetical protein
MGMHRKKYVQGKERGSRYTRRRIKPGRESDIADIRE